MVVCRIPTAERRWLPTKRSFYFWRGARPWVDRRSPSASGGAECEEEHLQSTYAPSRAGHRCEAAVLAGPFVPDHAVVNSREAGRQCATLGSLRAPRTSTPESTPSTAA